MIAFFGLLIPFLGTVLGASCVFFMKRALGVQVQRALTGFAAGVMVAASVWSLLIPAMEQAQNMGKAAVVPAVAGFWLGVLFLLLLDRLIPHLHQNSEQPEGVQAGFGRTTMMLLAVTLHNIPEGMAVGVVYAGFLTGGGEITAAGALALSLGIAIQNFPEGCDYFHAVARGRDAEASRVSGWCCLWCGGTAGRPANDSGGAVGRSGATVPVELCGGRDALRGGGGADSGNVRGQAFQYWYGVLCIWLYADDGVGCGAGIMGIYQNKKLLCFAI